MECMDLCCLGSWFVANRQNTFFLNFERVHPVVFILMYWIYLLPSTQQTIGYNGFTTICFDSHELSSGYVQNLLVWAVLLLTYSSGCCWSVWSGGCPYTAMNEILKHIPRIVTRKYVLFTQIVKFLSFLQVSWIRRKDYHLLTVGLATYSSDDRFLVEHARHLQVHN
jgi:hypothetical protein